MTIFDQINKIDARHLAPLYLIFGEDESLLSEAKTQLLKKVGYQADNLSQVYLDLVEADTNFALEELESLPFFEDQRLVIYENLWDISTTKKSVFKDSELLRLESYIDNPVDTTVLLIFVHGKLDSKRRIVKKLKQKAVLLEAKALTEFELKNYFMAYANYLNLRIEGQNLTYVFERSSYNFSLIKKNLELLKLYKDDKPVTLEDLDSILPKTLQDNIFSLTDMILGQNINGARALVSDLQIQGEDTIKLLAILTGNFRIFYQVKLLQTKGYNQAQITEFMKIHPYRIKLALKTIKSFSVDFLAHTLKNLIELDYQIKSGYGDKDYLFDTQLIKIALRYN
ncbi:DNA polymerase III subunit delta [Streptococcaceae bacterium ESL0687]|nr:DNA polymerase III subunit delta [Streptococcaceae bacterium ESL0687]